MADRAWILRVVFVGCKSEAIVAIKPVLGADPEVATAVLKDDQASVLRETIFNGQVLELNDAARGDIQIDVASRLWRRGSDSPGKGREEKNEGDES
jgi:hypothetical protein